MSPIEILIDGKPHETSGTGPTTISLPNPPGGEVSWLGDEASSGIVVTGKEEEGKFFELKKTGDEVPFVATEDLSAGLFPFAENVKKIKIAIRRK